MRHGKWIFAALVMLVVSGAGPIAVTAAQDAGGVVRQIALTEAQVKGLIAAQPDLAKIAQRLEGMPEDADVSVKPELDAIAVKYGFKDFVELDDVSANVQLVLDGLDPETGQYTDPIEGLKQELEEVKADPNLPDDEKKALIAELEEAVTAIPPLEHNGNIAIVKKYHKAILEALDGGQGAEQAPN